MVPPSMGLLSPPGTSRGLVTELFGLNEYEEGVWVTSLWSAEKRELGSVNPLEREMLSEEEKMDGAESILGTVG